MPHSKPIPQIKDHWLLGNLYQFKPDPFQALCSWQRDFGGLVSFKLLLSMIIQQYDIQLINHEEVKIDMAVSLRPKGGIPIRLKRL